MLNATKVSDLINAIIPISRFNKGEANKIFEEVNNSGPKIVVKNNKPTCVLIDPIEYQEMIDMIEDLKLLALAEQRTTNLSDSEFISQEDIMKEYNITEFDINSVDDVEIE